MPNAIDMRGEGLQAADARRAFLALWVVVSLLKLVVAIQLPLFVDEAFYWQEGQHPGWAYSDLPGLTAWLIRIGEGAVSPESAKNILESRLRTAAVPTAPPQGLFLWRVGY